MALHPQKPAFCSRALRVGMLMGTAAALASCSTTRQVEWHSQGERSQLDTAATVVFDGDPVLAARADKPLPDTALAWRDDSLNIREVESQWQDAMWPERHHRRGYYHRFYLPRNAETVLYFHDTYSTSTRSRSYNSYGGWGRSHGHHR